MRYTPRHDDSSANVTIIVLFIAGFVMFLSSRMAMFSTALMQLLGLAFFVAALYMMLRYKLLSFDYLLQQKNTVIDAAPEDDEVDFVVQRTQGNRSSEVCRMALSDLRTFTQLPLKGWRHDAEICRYGKDIRIYNYCPNMHPNNPYTLIFHNGDGTYAAVVIEPGADLTAYITNYLRNRSRSAENM